MKTPPLGTCLMTYRAYDQGDDTVAVIVTSLSWSPDSTRIVSCGQEQLVNIWDARTGETLFVVGEGRDIQSVSWSPDGNFIAMGGWNGTWILDVRNGEICSFLRPPWPSFALPVWSPDGMQLAVAWNRANAIEAVVVQIYQRQNWQERLKFSTGQHSVSSLQWSPDGTRIASAGDGDRSIQVWWAF